ncbi:MAG: class I SAM-dependent methyltransferase [Rhodospirillaceae bacterium]
MIAPPTPPIAPSVWVLRWAPLIRAGGRVLDVAAGHGRHARALQAMGHQVLAADIDTSGLRDAPGIDVLAADLETGPWPFPASTFDAIVVANYLHRPHFPHLISSLAPGGVLIFDTFGQGNERLGRPRNPDFLLAPGELLRAFDGALEIVAYEHGAESHPRPAVRQRLCARKGIGPVPSS